MKANRSMQSRRVADNSDVTGLMILAVLSLLLSMVVLTGCATTPNISILPGSDNVTITATVDTTDPTTAALVPYVVMANEEIATALELYETSKDASAMDRLKYWTAYALGVAMRIEAIRSGA